MEKRNHAWHRKGTDSKFIKFVSILLCFSMLIGMFPAYTEATPEEEVDIGPKIVSEMTDLRDEYSKVFMLDDGTFTAISAAEALHYQDDEGEWKDIDNTLTEDGNGNLTNAAAGYKVRVPKTLTENKPVTMEKDGHSLSFTLLTNIGRPSAKLESEKEKKSKREKLTPVTRRAGFEKKTSRIQFDALLSDTKVELFAQPKALKENVILQRKPKKDFNLSYSIQAAGLDAVLHEDGSIDFNTGDGELIFSIPSPYMYDSGETDNHSSDIAVTLTEEPDGSYTMKYVPSGAWLADKNTKYPVTIDPTVQTGRTTANVIDTYITSGKATTNHSAKTVLYPAMPWDSDGEAYALIRFNALPGIQSASVVTNAEFHVFDERVTGQNTSEYNNANDSANVYQIKRSWADTITWSSFQANGASTYFTESNLIDNSRFVFMDSTSPALNHFTFDVTQAVQDWYTNGNNYGFLIKPQLHSRNFMAILSGNYASTEYMPYLELNYQRTIGVSSTYDYHEMDVGRAGTVYINDYTGRPYIKRADMDFGGNVMPLPIEYYYEKDQHSYGYWMASQEQFLVWLGNFYAFYDENTAAHFFEVKEEQRFKDENNVEWEVWKEKQDTGYELRYKLTSGQAANYNLRAPVKIITPDNRTLHYNTNGVVVKIEDNVTKKSITLTHMDDNANAPIPRRTMTYAEDGAGRVYRYIQTNGYELSRIEYLGAVSLANRATAPSLFTVTYEYDTTNTHHLKKVTYPDGSFITYTYGTSGHLMDEITSITDIDGYKLQFSYTAGANPRVSKVEEFASDGTAGDFMTITYATNTTTFTDSRGRKEIKQFDQYGNTTSVRDENGYAIFSAYGEGDDKHRFIGSSDLQIPGENNLVQNWNFSQGTTGWTASSNSPPVQLAANTSFPALSPYCGYIQAEMTQKRYIKQRVQVTAEAGETFAFGGWGFFAAPSLPKKTFANEEKRRFGLRIEVLKKGSASETEIIAEIDYDTHFKGDLRYQKSSFTLDRDVSFIDLYCVVDYQASNYAPNGANTSFSFTGLELQRKSLFYAADPSGNIGEQTGTAPESETSIIHIDHSKTKEDEHGRVTESISAAGVGKTYTYDEVGNITTSAVTNGRVKMETRNEYTPDGNFLTKSSQTMPVWGQSFDAYTYNTDLGTLSSHTKGPVTHQLSTTNYTYDNMQRLTNVTKPVMWIGGTTQFEANYTYENDRLKTISHNNSTYTFSYDKWGGQSGIAVGTQTLFTTQLTDNVSRLLSKILYGNNGFRQYSYDSKDRLTGVKFEGDVDNRFTYTYNQKGEVTEKTDAQSGTLTRYTGDMVEEYDITGTTLKHSYVTNNDRFIEQVGSRTWITEYKNDIEGRPIGTTANRADAVINAQTEIRYDDLGRVTSKGAWAAFNQGKAFWQNYTYYDIAGFQTSEQINSIRYSFGFDSYNDFAMTYYYDQKGYPEAVCYNKNGQEVIYGSYTYDEGGRLTSEYSDYYDSIEYQYDSGGNILLKNTYNGAFGILLDSVTYQYNDSNWKDKLTSYDGKAITYDAIGNPTAYDGWTYTWEGGRQLKSMAKTGQNISYKYNDNGIRTSKTVNGVTTNYYTVDGRITAEETNNVWTYFHYDQTGELLAMELDSGSLYYYLKDALGNIIGLAAFLDDYYYEVKVEYKYDAWGNLVETTGPLSSTVGAQNPFLYKGYYFDLETGYYYLQSRYYSPEWCRFINADDPVVLNLTQGDVMGVNLFAYCENNPVMFFYRTALVA